jgi:hypothetical protein
MELNDFTEVVKDHVRNYFNENNSPDDPPVDSAKYRRFLKLCKEIHEFTQSKSGTPSAYNSETVIGLHHWTKGSRADGTPVGWEDIFARQLNPYRRMFTGSG